MGFANRNIFVRVGLASLLLIAGCAIDPVHLATPKQLTCIYLPNAISFSGKYGIGYTWTTRLERGAYWSEKVDSDGTYFRGPSGGIRIGNEEHGLYTAGGTSDGGFYIPNDTSKPINTYWYFTTEAVSPVVPPANVNCSNTVLVRDPSTSKLNVAALVVSGGAGGAVGGLIGKGITHSNISYGQAAGGGAVAGAAAGLIIGTIINSEVGKITPGLEIKDKAFEDELRRLANATVVLHEVSWQSVESIEGSSEARGKVAN